MIDANGVRDRLRQLCAENDINSKIMAYRLDVNLRTVNSWLHGERVPGIEMMIKLSDAFGVSLDWLYRGHGHD